MLRTHYDIINHSNPSQLKKQLSQLSRQNHEALLSSYRDDESFRKTVELSDGQVVNLFIWMKVIFETTNDGYLALKIIEHMTEFCPEEEEEHGVGFKNIYKLHKLKLRGKNGEPSGIFRYIIERAQEQRINETYVNKC